MAIRVADLPELTHDTFPRPFLYCSKCGAEYSADAGDYWNAPDNHVFMCCRRRMLLVIRRSVLEEVR